MIAATTSLSATFIWQPYRFLYIMFGSFCFEIFVPLHKIDYFVQNYKKRGFRLTFYTHCYRSRRFGVLREKFSSKKKGAKKPKAGAAPGSRPQRGRSCLCFSNEEAAKSRSEAAKDGGVRICPQLPRRYKIGGSGRLWSCRKKGRVTSDEPMRPVSSGRG